MLKALEADGWVGLAESKLAAAGHRASAPRGAVLEVIGRQECVLSAHEIAYKLKRRKRPVGIATVYRTLELLEDLKLVQRLDTGDGSARFEPAMPDGEHHHHHFVCEDCGTVAPFEDERLERAIHDLERRLAHTVREHDVILRGKCGNCE